MDRKPCRLVVLFVPQHWANGIAVPSGVPEPVDVTDRILAMPAGDLHELKDGNVLEDSLIDPEERGHLGPYALLCVAQVLEFFEAAQLDAITETVIDAKRREVAAQVPLSPRKRWLVGDGSRATWIGEAGNLREALVSWEHRYPGHSPVLACALP